MGDGKLAELRREYDERKEMIGVVCGERVSRDLMERKLTAMIDLLAILFPEAAILLVSDGDRYLWPDGILSPQITDFQLHCAQSKVKPKMAERSGPDTFLEGVKYGLEKVGKANITLKPKQEEILKIIALTQKDVLAILPTGYGKSLIYQIMPPLMDYMDSGQRPTQKKSIVLVVSPLNASIRDQVTKLKQSGLKACILKGDHVEGEEEERKEQEGLAFSAIENLKEFQLIFAHPEALVANINVIKLLKTAKFKNCMKAIVVDEAHLIVDW